MKNIINKKAVTISLFVLIGLLTLQVPLAKIYGTDGKFSLFDAFAPTAGAFLGTVPGVISVLAMRLVDYAVHGTSIDRGMVLRLFPVAFGAIYFANKKKHEYFNIIIPVISIVAFNLNPVGREVWYFSMYWLIPIAMHFVKDRFVFARSLGATFTQHSIGGALWVWFLHLPPQAWIALIPIVAIERFAIAVGMTASYLLFNNLLSALKNYMKTKNMDLSIQINENDLVKK